MFCHNFTKLLSTMAPTEKSSYISLKLPKQAKRSPCKTGFMKSKISGNKFYVQRGTEKITTTYVTTSGNTNKFAYIIPYLDLLESSKLNELGIQMMVNRKILKYR